ncbi:hypothetical protein BBF96_07185 [Anoxybacter fermentans]|uniref:HTH arsR-type domain-containing protein n=1 Tax=Anoxybacter fermentans TaxID=1323375 RepID=A0A3S9SXY4_9FIRM|nr:metalloregulator ArsR/SmtB family transcription factor [Anoxybacter fermentans]AZR73187.1 hypothetical protein BBF96_07185 [Anoxybacter fermentans]
MHKLIQFLKCISDETRFKILKLLLDQQLCVCELTEILGKSQPCISQHLRRFKDLDLVVEERREQWSYYKINYPVYSSYLDILNNLQNQSYSALGMDEIETNLYQIKSMDLCRMLDNNKKIKRVKKGGKI